MDTKALIDDLGSGCASVRSVRQLQSGQLAKRILMLKMLMAGVDECCPKQGIRSGFTQAHAVLANLQASHPGPIRQLFEYPGLGAWLGHCLRRLARAADMDEPLWADLGYLGWTAAVAMAKVGLPGRLPVVIRAGRVMLPGTGLVQVAPSTESGLGEFCVRGTGVFEIRFAETAIAVSMHQSDRNPAWLPVRRITIPGAPPAEISIDDLDPFLNAEHSQVNPRHVSWQSLFDSASDLLHEMFQDRREPIVAWLRAVQPSTRIRPWHTASSTSPECFGSLEASGPHNATELTRILIHEFQHAVLGGLTDYVTLTVPDSGQVFYAPWIDAMRSAESLLQGAYAHFGVAAFWRKYRDLLTTQSLRRSAEVQYSKLQVQVTQSLEQLHASGLLTAEGDRFIDQLRTATERQLPRTDRRHPWSNPASVGHRDPRTRPPLTARLLGSYFDLHSDAGPLHARIAADLGNRLLSGRPISAYQTVLPARLRMSISQDCPDLPVLSDPRELPTRQRTPQWSFLCVQLERWDKLGPAEQLRVARVLARLGFWKSVASLPVRHGTPSGGLDQRRLAYLHCTALLNTHSAEPGIGQEAYRIQASLAEDPGLPFQARLSAAVNVTVVHARFGRDLVQSARWKRLAETLVKEAPPGDISDLLMSAYWRGVSLVPFFEQRHDLVADMLDEAEWLARRAAAEPARDQWLLAAENLHLVLEARAWAADSANDEEAALRYYRELLKLDPLDSKGFVRIGDFYRMHGKYESATRAYEKAAILGAPYTAHARVLHIMLQRRINSHG
jgi:HEXXH motif-containing protein